MAFQLIQKEAWVKYRKQIIAFWILYILMWLFLVLLFWGVGRGMLGDLPTFEELENPQTAVATEIFSSDSVLIGKYFKQNRSPVTFDELSPNVVEALIATEDVRFYKHSGIDFRALSRAIVGAVTFNFRGGASTLTQQLAKNLFHNRMDANIFEKIAQKLKEQVLAVRLESRYTKEEILQMYLNTVEFSDNAFGIKSAAKTYFNKTPGQLDIEEAAVLVGMLKAPYAFNPRLFPQRSCNRRNVVLFQMKRYGYLPDSTYTILTGPDCPIVLDFKSTDHLDGPAPYFREFLRLHLQEWANKPENEKPGGGKYNIYEDGLKVYTTINAKMQTMAEEAVAEHMPELQEEFFKNIKNRDLWKDYKKELNNLIVWSERYQRHKADTLSKDSIMAIMNKPIPMEVFSYKGMIDTVMSPIDSLKYYRKFLQTGFIVVDPLNGHIKAWVGGTNYEYFKYDHITSKRQIGSTFKPFIYAAAIDNGYSPCFKIQDIPITFEDYDNWTPKNSDNKYTGDWLTLKQCLAESKNTCSAYLIKKITPQEVIRLARALGITAHIDPYPAICLGTPEISAFEMAGSYTAFVNKGFYTKPIFFTGIYDKTGNQIGGDQTISNQAMSEEKAYIMVELLRNVVNHGTGGRLRYRYKFTADMCGKTGTTNDQTDGWFVGFTPELIGAVWTGGETNFIRFNNIAQGQGAHMALPIWGNFFDKLYKDKSLGYTQDTRIPMPEGKLSVELDCSKYETPDSTKQGNWSDPSNQY